MLAQIQNWEKNSFVYIDTNYMLFAIIAELYAKVF
jgi:hypothetical protein